ncbi:hypothetical protein PM082_008437 [Marasmius tenuissimus]|nr:hypothetical protein PM082_008437 [Marasmius tenuissimus]
MGSNGMPLDKKAFFISLWLETVFYGFHTVLFCFCIYILLRRKKPGYAVFLVTAIFIFVFSTMHILFTFTGGLKHFTKTRCKGNHCPLEPDSQGAPLCPQQREKPWPNLISPKTFAYVMNGFFADALVVYRCYAIWNFEAYCIIPGAVLLLITAMVGVADVSEKCPFIQPGPPFFALSLVTNLYATLMAAGRLYYLRPVLKKYWRNRPDLQRRSSRAFIIVLETGAFNSACFVIFLILCTKKTTEGAALLVQDCVAQFFGIVPTLIIVIVGIRSESEITPTPIKSHPNRKAMIYRPPRPITSSIV